MKRRESTPIRRAESLDLPSGAPLHLELPGQITKALSPFVLPERLERLRGVVRNRTLRLTLLLEEVHDAHNIAACIRTCEAFGVLELHLIPSSTKPLKMSRLVASGADRWLHLHIHEDLESACEALKSAGYRLAVTDAQVGEKLATPSDIAINTPLCIAFGNEHDGVSPALKDAADLRVHIPMSGFVESLNISVAVAIVVSRIRERLESQEQDNWRLDAQEELELLDDWILEDVPHAKQILKEIAKRQRDALSGELGSA